MERREWLGVWRSFDCYNIVRKAVAQRYYGATEGSKEARGDQAGRPWQEGPWQAGSRRRGRASTHACLAFAFTERRARRG